MRIVTYMFIPVLAVIFSMEATAVVLPTLLPLAILALVLAVPIAVFMALGWVFGRAWRGFQGGTGQATGHGEVVG
jgi:hypothetical protein